MKAYLTYNTLTNELLSLTALTTDGTVSNKEKVLMSNKKELPLENVGVIELSEEDYNKLSFSGKRLRKSIVDGVLVMEELTAEEAVEEDKAKRIVALKNDLIDRQLKLDAGIKLGIDMASEASALAEVKAEYEALLNA